MDKFIRNITTDCGVDFDENLGALVIDHASYVVLNTDSDHTLCV
jgi:hypothetical protein